MTTIVTMGAASAAPEDGRQRPVGYASWSPRGATFEREAAERVELMRRIEEGDQ
jgi:hypothetical protein